MDAGAQAEDLFLGTIDHFELERRARVIVPDFDRVDPVPARALAARQQKENRSGSRAAFNLPRVAKGFAIVPALRVRLESERAYYFGRSGRGHGYVKICSCAPEFPRNPQRAPAPPSLFRRPHRADRHAGKGWLSFPRRWRLESSAPFVQFPASPEPHERQAPCCSARSCAQI